MAGNSAHSLRKNPVSWMFILNVLNLEPQALANGAHGIFPAEFSAEHH